MTTTETTVETLAAEASGWFETAKRNDDTPFTRTKDGCPDWIIDMIYEAHGEMLPDDWRYKVISGALDWLAEGNDPDRGAEFADQAVDVYTNARIQWLGSHGYRPGYVDDAATELGGGGYSDGEYGRGGGDRLGIIDMIALGQYAEAEEVFGSVLSSLRERATA